MSDVYQTTNNESRTRFGFRGSAKIDSDWSAGYRIEIGIRTADSGQVSQFDGGDPGDDLGANAGDLRHAFWWLESKSLGRLTVGQTDTPTSSTFTVTLANIVALSGDVSSQGAGFFVRDGAGNLTNVTWLDLMHTNQGSLSRRNLVMYTTPEFAGFQAAAAWGESDFWSASLAYAGEFSGFRLAAKVAYADVSDSATFGLDGTQGCIITAGNGNTDTDEVDCNHWVAGASVLHVPTGLFLSGGYVSFTDNNRAAGVDDNDTAWWTHAGIEQKYFAIGKTTLYGEYGEQENGNFDPTGGTTMSFWGLGLTQSVDAAAMDLYLFYRNYSVEVEGFDADDLTMVGGGAIIRF
jgi:predicted porin